MSRGRPTDQHLSATQRSLARAADSTLNILTCMSTRNRELLAALATPALVTILSGHGYPDVPGDTWALGGRDRGLRAGRLAAAGPYPSRCLIIDACHAELLEPVAEQLCTGLLIVGVGVLDPDGDRVEQQHLQRFLSTVRPGMTKRALTRA